MDVKAQMNRTRHLVDVLPACTLSANGAELNLSFVYSEKRHSSHDQAFLTSTHAPSARFSQISQGGNRQAIALDAETSHYRLGNGRNVGMVAKSFPGVHIADVQLDHRHASPLDGIMQRNTGVGVGTGVKITPASWPAAWARPAS